MTRTTPHPPSRAPRRRARFHACARLGLLVAAVIAAAALSTACGKKGSPLPPLVKMPAIPADIAVRRAGDTVYIRFTVPTFNADRTAPADLSRMQVYAYTAVREVEGLQVKDMTLVGEVLVRKPLDPAVVKEERENPEKAKRAAEKPRPVEPGVEQGTTVTVTEAITPAIRALTPIPKALLPPPLYTPPPSPWSDALALPVVAPMPEPQPRRFYVVFGVNHRGQRSNQSPRFAVAFDVEPPPPGLPVIAVKERTATITWNPPAGAAAPLQPLVADPQLLPSSTPGLILPVLPTYNIYAVTREDAERAAGGTPIELAAPLNPKPLTEPTFVDTAIEFGKERCYQVRTVNGSGTASLLVPVSSAASVKVAATGPPPATPASAESAPSPLACIVPADTEAPPAPSSLAAVASAGTISLIWNAVDVPDLAGYLVLRSDGATGPMTPLFTTPVTDTTYRDTTVRPGVRYAYVVVAVDKATPPNRSPASNRVEETAR